MRESAIRRKIREHLKSVPGLWFCPVPGSRFGKRGVPDTICCYYGKFLGIEAKATGEEPSPLQRHEGHAIDIAGGIWVCADNLDTVKQTLEDIKNGR